jgi:hypothetical protein
MDGATVLSRIVVILRILTCLSAVRYFALHYGFFGNPNSLGAVMGVLVVPMMLWGVFTTEGTFGVGWHSGNLPFRSPDLDGYCEHRQVAETDPQIWNCFLAVSRLCTLQREFCSRSNVELLHPLKFNGISRAKPLAS